MKTNIKKEIHAKSIQELEKQLSEAKNSLRLMKFEHEQARVKDTSLISKKKNEIAVLSTVLREKSAVAKVLTDKEGGKNE